MKVLDNGKFSVYVYREIGQSHHLPHCHVRWADGATVVTLPLLIRMAGTPLPKSAKQLLLDHLEEICNVWNNINLERAI